MRTNYSTPREDSDSALMLSYSAGESEGFAALYERHKISVYRFFYFGSDGDEGLAGELFQDVWMTVVRGRKRFTKDICFSDWLRHIAWARLYDHLRLHSSRLSEFPVAAEQTDFPENVVAIHPNGLALSFDALSDAQLLHQLKSLTDDHREIVLLRYCFRMDFNEIARFLDVARSSVNRLHKEAVVCLRSSQPEAC